MMKMKKSVAFWVLCVCMVCLIIQAGPAAARELVYTPLPIEQPETVIAASRPFVTYLSKQLNTPITIRYEKKYDDILRLFKEGKIDIVHLGLLLLDTSGDIEGNSSRAGLNIRLYDNGTRRRIRGCSCCGIHNSNSIR